MQIMWKQSARWDKIVIFVIAEIIKIKLRVDKERRKEIAGNWKWLKTNGKLEQQHEVEEEKSTEAVGELMIETCVVICMKTCAHNDKETATCLILQKLRSLSAAFHKLLFI